MINKNILLSVFLLFSSISIMSFVTAACGVLSSPNDVTTLTGNESIDGATCFNVTAQNVTLDCAGYNITGNNTADTYGVYSNQLNTTVKNCAIQNFSEAIYYDGADNGT